VLTVAGEGRDTRSAASAGDDSRIAATLPAEERAGQFSFEPKLGRLH